MVRQALQTPDDFLSFRPGIPPLHKEGKRLIACRQCTLHNRPAFSDKNTVLRLVIVLQLVFIQLCVGIQLRKSKIRNLPDLNHVFHLKAIAKARQSCRAFLPVKISLPFAPLRLPPERRLQFRSLLQHHADCSVHSCIVSKLCQLEHHIAAGMER